MPTMPDPPPSFTVAAEVKPKSRAVVASEGILYFIIGAATPVMPLLESDRVLDARGWAVLILSALVGGAVSLKAFFSQSMAGGGH